jgi:hypothetical protein
MICLHDSLFYSFCTFFLKRTLFTDEQVALKKKEKEASEKWNNPWKKSESDKVAWEKFQIPNQSRVSISKSSVFLMSQYNTSKCKTPLL